MTGPALPGQWWCHRAPFRHWRATSVLDDQTYQRVASAFKSAFTDADPRASSPARSKVRNYDAEIVALNSVNSAPFSPLLSEEWITSLHVLLNLPRRRVIDAALHSSPAGSRTGWIHTDLCSAWFDERDDQGSIVFADRSSCDYFTGRAKTSSARPREYVRAATMIFYLANEGWAPGDGGETGLYGAAKPCAHTTVAKVAPIDNTLVLFECSPHSYHRFLANPGRRRNSIILWLHADVGDAERRWPGLVHRRKVTT